MQKLSQNIAIKTLNSFSRVDRKEFLQLVEAKYFKLDKKNVFFFKQLCKLNLEKVDSSELKGQLNKNEAYKWSSQTLRESLSKLNTLFKEYIYLRESKDKKFNNSLVLSEFYLNNGISLHASTLNNFLSNRAELGSFAVDSEYYQLHKKLIVWDKIIKGRTDSDNFRKAYQHLNYAYWVEMLRLECEIKNRRDKLKNFEILSLLEGNDKTLSFIKECLWDNTLIRLYFLLYQLESEEGFDLIFQEWTDSLSGIPKEDLKSISIYLLNYCIEKVNMGQLGFAKKYLKITEVLSNEKLLLEDGLMLNSSFNNIISVALKVKDIDSAEFYLEHYSAYLPEAFRVDTYGLCKSKILFEKKEFENALELLLEVNLQRDFFFNVSTNVLQIKCYVELEMISVALNKIGNLELSIKRAKEDFSNSVFSEKCLEMLEILKLHLKGTCINRQLGRDGIVEKEWVSSLLKKKVSS